MKLVILFICCLSFFNVFEQSVDVPDIPLIATNVNGFIPEGWDMLMEGKGDLNEDGSKDLVFVIQKIGTELDAVYYHELPRILVIAFQQPPSRNYEVQLIKEDFILLASDGGVYGDPFEDIWVDYNGILNIDYFGIYNNKWSENFQFKLDENVFKLIKVVKTQYDHIDGHEEVWKYDLLEMVATQTYSNSIDSLQNDYTKKFKILPRIESKYLNDLPQPNKWNFLEHEAYKRIE